MRRSLLAILIVAAACTSGESPDGGAPPPAAAPPATPAGAVAPAQPAPAPAAKAPAFVDLVGAAKAASYKVTYKLSGSGLGEAGAGEQTWYVKPPSFRMDVRFGGDEASLFLLPNGTFLCTSDYGQKTCFGMPAQQGLGQNPAAQIESNVRARASDIDSTYEGPRAIAGQTAHCYATKAKAADLGFAEGRFCYSAQGLLLLMESRGSGFDMKMEATSVGAVSDADFQLPAKP